MSDGAHSPSEFEPGNSGWTSQRSRNSFAVGLQSQLRIIHALILRELSGRFGRENIGYLWIIGEPLMLASVITLVHLAQPSHFSSDIEPAPFAIIGYTIFIIFRGMVNRADHAIEGNQPLFYHRLISVLDIMIARAAIEAVGCISSTILLMTLAIMAGVANFPARPLVLLEAIGLMCWWAFALSLIAARATYKSETIGRQIHVLTYFCIPLSGAFFMLTAVPAYISNVLKWFPMTLIFEQARYGQFEFAPKTYVDPMYVMAFNATLTYIGILLLRRVRSNL